ncbi:PIN domain-containing protein [Rhodohalobacter halophilus]|uniref:PIN domain-containing protein n=1 Tax=Rhodohalobacter halophilus TaxID=1812810 RepID=UPI00083F57FB|nr:PIN domain-containing protein [Rhodohalobacter halophilus]
MKYIFLDTNVLIHYLPIDEIDWEVFFGKEELCFSIPYTVVQELDNHKYSDKSFLQKRSRKILSSLRKLENGRGAFSDKINVEILIEEHSESIYKPNNLDKTQPDERIIASILNYQKDNPEKDIFLVTGDFSMGLKAKKLGINVKQLNDEYLLPSSESEEQIELKKLRKENLRLKKLFPDVDLLFPNGKKHQLFTVHKMLTYEQDYIDKKIDELKSIVPKIDTKNNRSSLGLYDLASTKVFLSKSAEDYNSELDDYYESYREYLENRLAYLQCMRRSFEIKLIVQNKGTAPAEDLDIWLHFPDGFSVYSVKEFPLKRPVEPLPPNREWNKDLASRIPYIGINDFDARNFNITSNVGGLDINKTNSYEVETSVGRIKHNRSENIKDIMILYMPEDEVKGFNIDYRIDIGNYPDRIEGQLNAQVHEI